MTSDCRGLFLLEAREEAVKKAKHRKDIITFSNFEPMQKGAFEHGTNTKGKDTLLTRHTDKWLIPVRNEPPKAS